MQAGPPPASPPPMASPRAPALAPPSTVKGASATMTVVASDLSLVLTKARRAESAMVRRQVFLRYDVDRKVSDGVDPPTVQCGWRLRAYLQRSICFSSMTGLLGCTDPISEELPTGETGAADQGQDTALGACDLGFGPAREARDRVIAAVKVDAQARFDEDYALHVKPQLLASGVKITRPKS
jgi:hypothetical protein